MLTVAVMAALATSAPAQLQFEELGKRHLPIELTHSADVVLGDVDGDGDLDLVATSWNYPWSQDLRLCLNDGAGVFHDVTASRLPIFVDWGFALAMGDIDGDGDLDLIVGGAHSRILLNDGHGTFVDAPAGQIQTQSFGAMELADVDGDRDLDLVVATVGQNRLFLNDGAGRFTDATLARLPVDNEASSAVVLGDVDGDGDLDLVFGGYGAFNGHDLLYLNDGSGTFHDATSTQLPAGSERTRSAVMGDVDGDGDLDLVLGGAVFVGIPGRTRLYLNDGSGRFTDATQTRMPHRNDAVISVVLGDLDGDGDLDAIVGGSTGVGSQSLLYLNDGLGNFSDATSAQMPAIRDDTLSAALGDVDGDGDLDLVNANAGPDHLYLNDGSGTFADAAMVRLPPDRDYTSSLATGDVDGDGDIDLIVGNGGQNRLYLNDGCGGFREPAPSRLPIDTDATCAMSLADIDGDGDLDLLLAQYNQSRLLLNDGHGNFTDVTGSHFPQTFGYGHALAVGDVDGDGDLDVVSTTSPHGFTQLFLNDSHGVFVDATATRLPWRFNIEGWSLVLGDVDGDGDLDILVGDYRQVLLLVNNGTGTFTDATAGHMPSGGVLAPTLVAGDVDGDGDLDLVVGGYGQDLLYLNDGTGSFTDVTATHMPVDSISPALALGDVDGDGDLDIVLGKPGDPLYTDTRNRLFLNDGRGIFTDVSSALLPSDSGDTHAVLLSDIDGDGDLDLVVGNFGGAGSGFDKQNHLYENLLRQLDAPLVLRTGQLYRLDIYARNGPTRLADLAFPCLSTGTAHIPLPPMGVLGLDPNFIVALSPTLIPQPAGFGSLTVMVPNVPSLAGTWIYTQALLVQYPTQTLLTNVVGEIIRG